jgi:ferredoxin
METRRNDRGQAKTNYILLDSRKCEACWKCMEVCPNNVIGRVNLPWHKHALIIKRDNCIGCSKCIKACKFNAITKVITNNDKEKSQKKNPHKRLIINAGSFFSGFLAVFSGFLIQVSYHMGQHGTIDVNKMVLDVNYSGWTDIHKISILLLSVFMTFHIVQHWTWYKTVIKKKLIAKNKQVIILSTVFIFVAITGYIPWIIDLTINNQTTRKFFLEIHDKLTIILFVFLILHVTKRLRWFVTTINRIGNN